MAEYGSDALNMSDLNSRIGELAIQHASKKEGERIHKTANIVREASAHLGIETPLTVLVEIRSAMQEILDTLRHSREEEAERHSQLCTILLSLNDTSNMSQVGQETRYLGSVAGDRAHRQEYFYGDVRISTATQLVGVVMMQINNVLDKYLHSSGSFGSDSSSMGVKDWSSLVKHLLACDAKRMTHTGKISLPKPSSHDFTEAANIVCSTVKGRTLQCSVNHLFELMRHSASIAGCVAAALERLVKCPGLVSAERHVKMSRIGYPFALDPDTLNLRDPCSTPTSFAVAGVARLKSKDREAYIEKVLTDGNNPVIALNMVED